MRLLYKQSFDHVVKGSPGCRILKRLFLFH